VTLLSSVALLAVCVAVVVVLGGTKSSVAPVPAATPRPISTARILVPAGATVVPVNVPTPARPTATAVPLGYIDVEGGQTVRTAVHQATLLELADAFPDDEATFDQFLRDNTEIGEVVSLHELTYVRILETNDFQSRVEIVSGAATGRVVWVDNPADPDISVLHRVASSSQLPTLVPTATVVPPTATPPPPTWLPGVTGNSLMRAGGSRGLECHADTTSFHWTCVSQKVIQGGSANPNWPSPSITADGMADNRITRVDANIIQTARGYSRQIEVDFLAGIATLPFEGPEAARVRQWIASRIDTARDAYLSNIMTPENNLITAGVRVEISGARNMRTIVLTLAARRSGY
jgi:hypothetical protein